MKALETDEKLYVLNGCGLYVEMVGEGDPLVLLHGFTGSGRDFRLFGDALHEGFRAIVPDLRGHGRSTNPAGVFTHRQAARDIFALLDELGLGRFSAIGISAGGNTLLHMATQQPSRVEAMVIVSAAAYFPEQTRAIMRQTTVESRSEDEWRFMRESHAHGDAQIVALWSQARAFATSYDDMNFTPPHLSTITARTMIVSGDRDPLYPVSMAVDMYRAIPNASLWVVPEAGHGCVFEAKEQFIAMATKFLAKG
jgi:pimeloyl-ACP methyl ester carboxylesterase